MLHYSRRLDGEEESAPCSNLGLNPYFAAVPFHDFFADGRTHSRAWVFFLAMQALEHGKDSLHVFRLDAYTVVADVEDRLGTLALFLTGLLIESNGRRFLT